MKRVECGKEIFLLTDELASIIYNDCDNDKYLVEKIDTGELIYITQEDIVFKGISMNEDIKKCFTEGDIISRVSSIRKFAKVIFEFNGIVTDGDEANVIYCYCTRGCRVRGGNSPHGIASNSIVTFPKNLYDYDSSDRFNPMNISARLASDEEIKILNNVNKDNR